MKHHSSIEQTAPYRELFVYYLEGPVGAGDELFLGESYLGNWVEGESSFLFFSGPSDALVEELLSVRPYLRLMDSYHFTYEEWQGGVFKSLRIENLVVFPPWEDIPTLGDDIGMVIDPGVVFGTGLHPTTSDCLRALTYLKKRYAWKHVLDLGTGTGILAIAAAHMGARRVWAIDLNPLAVKTARRNVVLNRVSDKVEVMEGKAEDFMVKDVDLVLANLHYDVIRGFVEEGRFRSSEWIILSGLMRSQAADVRPRLLADHIEIVREWDNDAIWYTMLLHVIRNT